MLSFIQGLHLVISMMLLFVLLKYYKKIDEVFSRCTKSNKKSYSSHCISELKSLSSSKIEPKKIYDILTKCIM